MALTTDARDVKNRDILTKLTPEGQKVYSDEFESIAFGGMILGIPHITESNYQEWYRRYSEWSFVLTGTLEHFLTLATVREFIGFKSNVPEMSRAKWQEFIARRLREEMEKSIIKEALEAGIELHNSEYEVGQYVYLGHQNGYEVPRPFSVGRVKSVSGNVYTVGTDNARYLAEDLLSQEDVEDIG